MPNNAINPSRRDFLLQCTASLTVLASAPAICSLLAGCGGDTVGAASGNPTIILDISSLLVGASMVTKENAADGAPALVTRLTDTTFQALSMRCTHEGAVVNPPSKGVLYCSRHGSNFAAKDGSVINGPADTALTKFKTDYDASAKKLTIHS